MLRKIFGSSKKQPVDIDIDKEKLPRHIAVIMDGNGRWAKGQGLLRTAGHAAGVKTLKRILISADDMGIEALTVYAFSTENWKRPKAEVDFLLSLFSEYLAKELAEMHERGAQVKFIGDRTGFSEKLQQEMARAESLTENNTGIRFTIAANYGGRDEILRAAKLLAKDTNADIDSLTEADFEKYLDTFGAPPVDLVIRTSGEMRLSNFLLWQAAYAEFWYTNTPWPDFNEREFIEAIKEFAARNRRFGGV
ncbi:MAG: isoprenyl transferase [Selenomonadaceae bacterium]|nr:isoprenyl transferase [Selenomonadaceae bacterium]